jgi:cytochrome c peroxidase
MSCTALDKHLTPRQRYNPEGEKYLDLGLGAIVKKPSENGRFKVPTLRNVALAAPYMHNGVFKTLKEVVSFYNTRDTAKWPPAEVPDTVNKKELGNLGLCSEEVDSVVAFLMILTDGFVLKHTKTKSMQ